MPRPTQSPLPQPAVDHLPQPALDKLPDHIKPGPNIIWDNPHTALDTLTGTNGQADVFVFDVSAEFAYRGDVPTPTEIISNFEPNLDVIAFVNIPAGAYKISEFTGDALLGDPSIPDTETMIFSGSLAEGVLTGDTGNAPISNVSAAYDNTVLMPDGHILTLPPDPWLLA